MALARVYPNLRRNGAFTPDVRLGDDPSAGHHRYRSPYPLDPAPRHGGRMAPGGFDPHFAPLARRQPVDARLAIAVHPHQPYDALQYYPQVPTRDHYYPPSRPRRCHHPPRNTSHCGCATPTPCRAPKAPKEPDFKTKDIVVRGKGYAVRASFLTDISKFEADVQKYVDKKKPDEVPDRIVEMLISFINQEKYHNSSLVDEVVLNILASNIGIKSIVKHSLDRLKGMSGDVGLKELGDLLVLVMCSARVDEGLQEWFCGWLQEKGRYGRLFEEEGNAGYWRGGGERVIDRIVSCHPEAVVSIEQLMGLRGKEMKDPFRIL